MKKSKDSHSLGVKQDEACLKYGKIIILLIVDTASVGSCSVKKSGPGQAALTCYNLLHDLG